MNPTRINRYRCGTCRGEIITIDRAAGVTPMFLSCRATAGCSGRMTSEGYPDDPELVHNGVPTWEWVTPAPGSAFWKRNPEHCKQGGLELRKIGEGGVPVVSPLERVRGWRRGKR